MIYRIHSRHGKLQIMSQTIVLAIFILKYLSYDWRRQAFPCLIHLNNKNLKIFVVNRDRGFLFQQYLNWGCFIRMNYTQATFLYSIYFTTDIRTVTYLYKMTFTELWFQKKVHNNTLFRDVHMCVTLASAWNVFTSFFT